MGSILEAANNLILSLEGNELVLKDIQKELPKATKTLFNKARKIAKQQNKQNDKKTVTGIVQSFLEG